MQRTRRCHVFTSAIVFSLAACGEDLVEERSLSATFDHDPVVEKELLIRDLAVVQATRYTSFRTNKHNTDPEGGWSFGRLMDNLGPVEKPSSLQRTHFTLTWLKHWEVDQEVNGYAVPARPLIRALVIDPWRAASGCGPDPAPLGAVANDGCSLDFTKAPFRLLAIVNRPDLRVAPRPGVPGRAGEGRFVFAVLGPTGAPLPFTVIFEYSLPVGGKSDVIAWAERWHKLGLLRFGNDFNDKLFAVTKEFTKWNLVAGRTNGSAINQIRTNEVILDPNTPKLWELREFVLAPTGGQLVQTTVKQEPAGELNGSALLGAFAGENRDAIVAGAHVVPDWYGGVPFLAGSAIIDPATPWTVPGADEPTRRALALATCSGCHFSETGGVAGTNFLHIKPAPKDVVAAISPFLADELAGPRKADFASLLESADHDVKDGPASDPDEDD